MAIINGNDGDNLILGSLEGDSIYGLGGDDTIYGSHGENPLDGDDNLYGGDGNDTIFGYYGNDLLDGGDGNDTLYGGQGNDNFYGGVGDYLSGDNGIDYATIDLQALTTGVDATLTPTGTHTFGGVTISQIESLGLTLGSGNDRVDASAFTGDLSLHGNGGDDALTGGAGDDTLTGGAGNDALTGGAGSDYLDGWIGNDYIYGGNENDTLYGYSGVDVLYGDNGNDNLYGESDNDYLYGGNHDDQLDGGDGNDQLDGGYGDDRLYGGNGDDYIYAGDNYGYLTVESLYGGAGNDQLYGVYNSNSYLEGGDGNDILAGDTMVGGLGNDTYYVNESSAVVTETSTLATEIDRVYSTIAYTLGANVEELYLQGTGAINATGNNLNNLIVGNSANNILKGGDGNDTIDAGGGKDTLNGGTGADKMTGGTGNDTYVVDNVGDVVTETSALATEIDTVQSTVSYTLGANVESLSLVGTSAINGTGNNLKNTIIGNSANNVLNGGTGADNMTGGLGNDTYKVDNAGDVVKETSTLATEIDRVESTVSYTLGANVEELFLLGSGTLNGTGNSLNNTILGNLANNILTGGAGNDTLLGGAGNDVLVGGAGNDTLNGGAGNDRFAFTKVSDKLDTIKEFAVGSDLLQISASGFGGGLVAGGLSASQIRIGSGITTANTTAQRFIYNTANGALYFDADGSGTGFGAVQFASLYNKASINQTSFSIVA